MQGYAVGIKFAETTFTVQPSLQTLPFSQCIPSPPRNCHLTMSLPSLLQALSLIPQPALSSLPPPNFVPHFLIFAWLFAYALTSTRLIKRYYGMDHNCSPREDVSKYGEIMVKDEKITRDPLDMVKRWEGCHANCVEGFPVLVAGVVSRLLQCFWYFVRRKRQLPKGRKNIAFLYQ